MWLLTFSLLACPPLPDGGQESGAEPCVPEVCNGLDDDCDGEVDEDPSDGGEVYLDYDKDGYGGTLFRGVFCALLPGSAWGSTDCDDGDPDAHPGAEESCNSRDDDCDGEVDEGIVITCFEDADEDGWGVSPVSISSCDCPDGTTLQEGDCDDTNPAVYPDRVEICSNGVDDDCDGVSLECDFHGDLRGLSDAAIAWLAAPDSYGAAAWSLGDPDGRGTEDLVVATSMGAFVLTGPFAGDVDVTAAPTVLQDLLNTAPAPLGDVDGDGFDDVAVDLLDVYGGEVRVLRGPLSGVITPSDAWATILLPSGEWYFGKAILSGDFLGDGFPALAVGTGTWTWGDSAWIVSDLPPGEVQVEDVGWPVDCPADAVGDVNGDGVDDLVGIGVDSPTCVKAALGPLLDGVEPEGVHSCVGDHALLPKAVSIDGDVDGDGQADLLVSLHDPLSGGWPGSILVVPHLSAAETLEGDASSVLVGEAEDDMAWKARAVNLGADENAAVAVAAPGVDHVVAATGAVYLLYDVPPGTTSLSDADVKIVGTEEGARVGTTLELADTRGLGTDDLLIGAALGVYVVVP